MDNPCPKNCEELGCRGGMACFARHKELELTGNCINRCGNKVPDKYYSLCNKCMTRNK